VEFSQEKNVIIFVADIIFADFVNLRIIHAVPLVLLVSDVGEVVPVFEWTNVVDESERLVARMTAVRGGEILFGEEIFGEGIFLDLLVEFVGVLAFLDEISQIDLIKVVVNRGIIFLLLLCLRIIFEPLKLED
jgi:hypothetical protein